jgi:hypothetical protein
VGSRERRRAERRKRKARSAERRASHGEIDSPTETPAADGSSHSPADLARRAEAKDEAAREALEPLREGDRPLVVTLGAGVSALICLSILIAYAAGAEVDGERPNFAQVLAPALLMGVMAWGMWRARYWAVLGFQVVLLFLIIATALGLVRASSAAQVIGNVVVLSLAATFFYFMVKALARIQMPDRTPHEKPPRR